MKNKKLFTVLLIICIVLAVEFVIGKKNMQKTEELSKDIPTIGVLQFVSHPALDEIYQGIQDGLQERGYEDKKTMNLIFQNGQADQSKLSTMSQQLIEKKSDILVGIATPAAQALANSTSKIPIVLGAITDPVSANLVKDNDKPGGNITGVSDKSPVDAQFDLVTQLLPKVKKIGILYSSAEDNSDYQAELVKKEAEKKGMKVKLYPVPSGNEISQMTQVITSEMDAIYIPTDNTIANAMQTVVDIANKSKTPIIPSVDTMVEQGGLATVSINQHELGVQTGYMIADILEGKSKTETTPIYTFKTGDIIINEKQAEKLGVKIPETILEKIQTKKKEQPENKKKIGLLQFISHPALDEIHQGIIDGLEKRGYIDKDTSEIFFQNAQGDQNKLNTMSQQLLDKKCDLLIGIGTAPSQALANGTKETPIIMGAVGDPLTAGLITDMKHPGGNVTGVQNLTPVEEQFDLIQKIFPQAKKVGTMYSSAEDNSKYQIKLAKKTAKEKGLELKEYAINSANDIASLAQVMVDEVDVIYLPTDNTVASGMETIVDIANKKNIAIIPSVDTMVAQGGLAAFGVNQYNLGLETAKVAADVLDGTADTASTPVVVYKKGSPIINEQQAKKLEIKIPNELIKKAKIIK